MRMYITIILIFLLFPIVVLSATTDTKNVVPQDTNTQVIQTIQQEHKNTRKFTSDELTRQREQFFKSFETDADMYMTEGQTLIDTAYWKLGMIWASVVFFVVGLGNLLRLKLEEKKITLMKKMIVQELRTELNLGVSGSFDTNKHSVTTKQDLTEFENNFRSVFTNVDKPKSQEIKIDKRVTF